MDLEIEDKLALVTGASKGMGRAIAMRLADEGARVIVVSRTPHLLESLQGELSKNGKRHYVFDADLSQEGTANELATSILTRAGAPDIVVHNVGGSIGVTDPMASSDDWRRVWHFNLGAAIDLNCAFVPHMKERKWGRIVHISSVSAENFSGYPAYVSAKTALNGYVKSMGRALAKTNIVLSAVAPGPMYAEGRFLANLQSQGGPQWDEYCRNHLAIARLGAPEEVAAAVAWLCSKHASFAVGGIFSVDGGAM